MVSAVFHSRSGFAAAAFLRAGYRRAALISCEGRVQDKQMERRTSVGLVSERETGPRNSNASAPQRRTPSSQARARAQREEEHEISYEDGAGGRACRRLRRFGRLFASRP